MRKSKKFENFRYVGRVRAFNLVLQIILAATLFVGLNVIASRHYLKYDFSKNRANSLSPESVAHIKSLKKPVEIFLTMKVDFNSDQAAVAESKAIVKEISRMLEQYSYESASGGERNIKFLSVDPIVNRKKGDELAQRFGRDIENCIIVSCGDKFKKLVLSDLYDIDENGKRKNFKGELAVSSAILAVSSDKVNKIYFVKGHGELSYKSVKPNSGLSEFASALSRSGYKLDEIDLSAQKKLPADADMLIIAAPQIYFSPRELDTLKKYLNSNGRVVMFLGLGPIIGLDDLLFDWGLRADDMLVVDSAEFESSTGEIIARVFPQKPHPAAKYLIDLGLPVQFGSVRPVREDLGAAIDGNLSLFPLILSSHTSWAEKGYKNYAKNGKFEYNYENDIQGPVPLAMIATRKGGSELGLDIRGGRLAVFGDENFITNSRFNALGNSKLVMNTINWFFDENHSLNVAPRKVERYSLTISRAELTSLGLKFLLLPAAILLAGFLTYLFRRQ